MVAGLDTELKLQGDSGAMRLSVAYLFANIPRHTFANCPARSKNQNATRHFVFFSSLAALSPPCRTTFVSDHIERYTSSARQKGTWTDDMN